MTKGYTTDLLTEYSIDFVERHQDSPFFLYVPHLAIHFPWQGPSDPPHRVKGKDYWNDKWGIIADPGNVAPHVKAMVESVDDSVGRIVGALKRLGLAERTLVVFTSDNGGYPDLRPHVPEHFQQRSASGPEGVPVRRWAPGTSGLLLARQDRAGGCERARTLHGSCSHVRRDRQRECRGAEV